MNKIDSVTTMTDRQIQDWLRRISGETEADTLPIALSGVNDAIKECVFRNMSEHGKNAVQQLIQEQKSRNRNQSEIQQHIAAIEKLI